MRLIQTLGLNGFGDMCACLGITLEGFEELNKLPNISCVTPKGAFYAFPNISATGWKAKELANTLLEEIGVATVGGPDFGTLGEGYIRLSYANSAENIIRAIKRIDEFLQGGNA